ncbi:MAG: aldo/keto reductase [Gammaproteobacteria bacterium]|nr:aldo/keto reductase [Gammaproteobacteria bacterium]
MKSFKLALGHEIPVFGIGSWRMGEQRACFDKEVGAIRCAIDLGITLIDTAEMYGEGGAEKVIAKAIQGRRDGLFLISKFYPHNAGYANVMRACERSLRRLNCDYLDMYLYHWPGNEPLSDTFAALHSLLESGRIRGFGVSNFDLDDLQAIPPADQNRLGCNQIFYNLKHREVEWTVADWCQQKAVPLMAYSPLDQAGSLLQSSVLANVAIRHEATAAQVALAWLLHQPNTVVIPKSGSEARISENLAAIDMQLSRQDLAELDRAFPGPQRPVRLGMR